MNNHVDLINTAITAGIQRAVSSSANVNIVSATVVGSDSLTGIVRVIQDGSTATTSAVNTLSGPGYGSVVESERVLLLVVPPHGVFLFGRCAVGPPIAAVSQSTNVSIPSGSNSILQLDTANVEWSNIWQSSDSSHLYASSSGLWSLRVAHAWGFSASGDRQLGFSINGATPGIIVASPACSVLGTVQFGEVLLQLNTGDQVAIYGYQTSGGSLVGRITNAVFSRLA